MVSSAEISSALLEEIKRGDYGHAGKLPGEQQLANRFGAARGTVREALRELEFAEEIEVRPRHGWYVRGERRKEFPLRTIDSRLQGKDVWNSWLEIHGLEGKSLTTVSIEVPDNHVREHLGLAVGESCVVRHRIRRVRNTLTGDLEPWALSIAYWPLWLAEGTDLMRTGEGDEVDLQDPSPLGIAEAKGYVVDRNRDVITARPAEEQEVEALNLPARGYVLTVCRTSYSADGTPFRVTHDVLDNRRFRLIVEDRP